jgi:acyl-CoA synthetase (AMP-forming)/AMP-acid ligase II
MSVTWLLERMSERSVETALVWRDRDYSYRALLDAVDGWRRELDAADVAAGTVVAFEGDYAPNECALLLALWERAAIAVPLTAGVAPQREEFLRTAEVEVLIEFDEADRWTLSHRRVVPQNPVTLGLTASNEPGLIVFSSGSTGLNKAILHNASALLEKFTVPRHRMRVLTFLLLDHLGGINTLLYTLSNGGTVVAAESRDPNAVCRAVERHGVQLLPASPTFLNMLLVTEAHLAYDLSSLELISYGTEVMPETTLRRMRELLPNVRFLQTYGLSEVGVLRSQSKDSDSLWVKVGGEGFETKVVDGTLWIRASSAMVGYLNAPSPFDDEGWLNTEDVVEVDGDYLRILGRHTDLINVGGQKVYPAEVESVLLEMENIRDATVHGEPNALLGTIVAARVTLFDDEDPRRLKERVRRFCQDRLAPFKVPVRIEVADSELFGARYKRQRATKGAAGDSGRSDS